MIFASDRSARRRVLRAVSFFELVLAALLIHPSSTSAQAVSARSTAIIAGTTDAVAAQTATTTPGPGPVTAGWQDGFALQSADGSYRLTLGLLTQIDGRFSIDATKPITNTFTLRKARPIFAGRVAKYFDYRFMPDIGNGTIVLVDAYLDVRFSSAFRVRTGKDKTPVGYELLIGDAGLLFPERSLASLLVPNRDVGIQAQGDLAGGRLFYAGGVFNGVPDGVSETTEVDTNSGKDVAGRVVVQPFRAKTAAVGGAQTGLGFQIGGSTGQESGTLPSFKTSVGQTFFSYASGVNAGGWHHRVTPAVFYYHKRLGGFAEYVRSSQVVVKGSTSDTITNDGWDVSGSFILAGGGVANDRPVKPTANFDPSSDHWGAIQVVARYAEIHADGATFDDTLAATGSSQKAQQATVGVNWYPNPYIKYYLNYEHAKFSGGTARPTENAVFLRVQLAF